MNEKISLRQSIINQALVFLEQVISKDGENAEAQKDKFDVEINLGKSLIQQNEHDAAVKTFRAAFAGVQKAPMLKETPFVGYAEGRMHEQIGDCEMARIEKSNPPNQTRKSLLGNARAEYEKAVELWNDETSAPENSV